MPKGKRLDALLVERGLLPNRSKAKAVIMAGQVLVNGQKRTKAGDLVAPDAALSLIEKNLYVSRGGLKLKGAIDFIGVQKLGIHETCVALDIGVSTGGFTDCLLQLGVSKVYAIDVGKGQLDWRLRNDPRVVLFEQENIRHFDASRMREKVDLIVIDVSFISILKFIERLPEFLKPSGKILAMVKPQFEGEPSDVEKGGIVKNPQTRQRILDDWKARAIRLGFSIETECPSSLAGTDGNQEHFILISPPSR